MHGRIAALDSRRRLATRATTAGGGGDDDDDDDDDGGGGSGRSVGGGGGSGRVTPPPLRRQTHRRSTLSNPFPPDGRAAERAAAARTPRLCPMVKPAVTSARGGDTVDGVRACDVPLRRRRRRRVRSPRTAGASVFLVPKILLCDFSRLSSRATPTASPLRRRPPPPPRHQLSRGGGGGGRHPLARATRPRRRWGARDGDGFNGVEGGK